MSNLPSIEDLMADELNLPVKRENHKKNEENVVYTSFIDTERYTLEQIYIYNIYNNINSPIIDNNASHATHATYATDCHFLIYDKTTGTMDTTKVFTYNNKVFKPIVDELIDNRIVLLPSGAEKYKSIDSLIKEIKEFLYEYFEAPQFFENFFPYLVLFYWVYEKFPFIPYIHFIGRTGTGKSTALEVLGSICYKPIDASGAITTASIFRIASLWKGTLLLDEFNPGGDSYNEMLSLLKSGVSNKAVLRVEGDKKREVKAYLVKSPKIFTSEKPVSDAGLRSRIVEIKMDMNKRRIPLYRQDRFLVKAEELRNKLLYWRLTNLNKLNLKEIEYGIEELKSFQGRVQQVITPVYYLAGTEARKEIIEFAKEQQEETLRERRDSLEGQVFEVIYEHYQRDSQPSLSAIAEVINKDTKFPISERKLSNIIRKMLDFDIRRSGHENISTVVLENKEEHIKDLCSYYGIFLSDASVAHDASVAQAQKSDTLEQNGDTLEKAKDVFGS